MRVFLGLFTNLDSVIRDFDISKFEGIKPSQPTGSILNKKGEVLQVLKQNQDSEHIITKEIFDFLKTKFLGEIKIGGNAGNAALALSELGIPCVLSCPLRSKSITDMLSKYKGIKLASERGFSYPNKAISDDIEYEHFSFEGKKHRKIFTFDPMVHELTLDRNFWDRIKEAKIVWLCGFHLVSPEHKNKIDHISDILQETKSRVHLELGQGTETIRYAISKMIDKGVVQSLGMNEIETKFIGFRGEPLENTDFFSEFLKTKGIERLTVHSVKYRLTFFREDMDKNLKAGEYSMKVSAAKVSGSIKKNLEKVSGLGRRNVKKIRGEDFVLVPAYKAKVTESITGIGDTASIADALVALR